MQSLARCASTLTLLLSLLFLLVLSACPGGDAPFTRPVDGGHEGTEGSADARSAPLDAATDNAVSPADAAFDGTRPSASSGARCGVSGRNDCGPFGLCDPVRGCVECEVDDDCPLAARHCVAGACGECVAGAGAGAVGCSAGAPSCWPLDRTCHAACTSPSSCPTAAHLCDAMTGECRGCTTTADCTNGVCDPVSRQCVECSTDLDCAADRPRCDVARAVCEACSSNDDCGLAEPICDPASRRCRVGCTSDAQCPGQSCDPRTARCVNAAVDAGPDVADAGGG